MMNETSKKLREVCEEIRRKPYPIKDLIPLLQEAADALDYKKPLCDNYGRCNCKDFCSG